jgi:malate synthase
MQKVRAEVGDARFQKGRFAEARDLFERLSTSEQFEEFLTIPAYDELLREELSRTLE